MSDAKKRTNEAGGDGPPKKKSFWQTNKPSSEKAIPPNAIGIFVTCDAGRERKSAAESTNLFEEAYDKLGSLVSGKQEQQQQEQGSKGGTQEEGAAAAAGGSKSISAMLAAEVQELKDKKKMRFRWHDTGIKGTVFVEFPPAEEGAPSPVQVAKHILDQAKSSKQLAARHTMRLLPVTHTCFVSMEDVKQLADKVAQEAFQTGEGQAGCSFSVEFEHRACNTLKRMDVINAFAQAVPSPPYTVSLDQPQKSILVELVRNVCAVSVVEDFKGLCKYNARKAAEEEEEEGKEKETDEAGEAGEKGKEQEEEKAAAGADDGAAGS